MLEHVISQELKIFHGSFRTVLVDPPWRFQHRTGKVSPEHGRLKRYNTMTLNEIANTPVGDFAADKVKNPPPDLTAGEFNRGE